MKEDNALLRVKQIINSVCEISDKSFEEIIPIIQNEKIKKYEDFVNEGRYNNKEYFLLKGIVKGYVLNPEGEEITLSFFDENSVLSPKIIRTRDDNSLLNFKALSEVELAVLNANRFAELMVNNIEIRNFGNQVLRNELKNKMEKEIELASLTAKDRLERFREKYPLFENLIPHSDIASYLGITNVSLSRLRSKF